MKLPALTAAIVLFFAATLPPLRGADGDEARLRIIIETDAGGDPDDEQSLVRFLLYTNEWDVEGIIANRIDARDGENLNKRRTGFGIVQGMIEAYRECYPKLTQHDPRYPAPDLLLRRTVAGYGAGQDGVKLVKEVVDRADPRPVWFCNWGTDFGSEPSSLMLALDDVLRERGKDGYREFKSRLRLSSDDQFGRHSHMEAPPWTFWVDTLRPTVEGKRWYHRFSALTAKAGGFDIERDVRAGHGPLGASYPTNTTHPQKEGDTMMFLYLIPTGMNDPMQPGWGSWAGRYGPRDNAEGRPYHWANQADTWEGTSHRENTVRRWAAHFQNDFKARLDWCVKGSGEANHPPRPVVNGVAGSKILTLRAAPGEELKLDSSGSSDPDGQKLDYQWIVYPEAGTYLGSAAIEGAASPAASLRVPTDLGDRQLHVILIVTDRGDPPLTRYRRVIVTTPPR